MAVQTYSHFPAELLPFRLNPLNIGVAVQTLRLASSHALPGLNPLNIGVAVQTIKRASVKAPRWVLIP